MNFFNSGARVVKHTTGYSSAKTVLEGVGLSAREAVVNSIIKESIKADNQHYAKIEKDYEYKSQISAITEAAIAKDRPFKTVNGAYHEGKELLFKNILFEAFYESLYLDDDFKSSVKESLYGVVSDFVDERGGFKLLESAVLTTKSPFLKNIKNICEATARKACNRKLAEANGPIDFSLNNEEEESFNYSKNNVGIDELSELVKSKVLSVVKDEKAREQKEADLLQTLADETNKDVAEVEESMRIAKTGGPIVNEGTLFNALFIDSYTQYLAEGCSKKHKDVTENDDLEDEIDNFEIDMDVILVETITKYTLLELAHTIQLESLTQGDIRKMVQKMLNK